MTAAVKFCVPVPAGTLALVGEMVMEVGVGWAQQRTGVECEVRGSGAVARGVGVFGEVLHEREKCRRLADEESHVGEKLERAFGNTFCFGRTNDGTRRQLAA